MSEGMYSWTQEFKPDPLQKFLETIPRFLSSLPEGHANLLCIVPVLTDLAEATNMHCNLQLSRVSILAIMSSSLKVKA